MQAADVVRRLSVAKFIGSLKSAERALRIGSKLGKEDPEVVGRKSIAAISPATHDGLGFIEVPALREDPTKFRTASSVTTGVTVTVCGFGFG